jgi:hypothetical protein
MQNDERISEFFILLFFDLLDKLTIKCKRKNSCIILT